MAGERTKGHGWGDTYSYDALTPDEETRARAWAARTAAPALPAATSEPMAPSEPRMFTFRRLADESGISGTGRVLDGVRFHNGTVAVCWRTDVEGSAHGHSSIGVYPSWEAFEFIHIASHPSNGTVVEWLVTPAQQSAQGPYESCPGCPRVVRPTIRPDGSKQCPKCKHVWAAPPAPAVVTGLEEAIAILRTIANALSDDGDEWFAVRVNDALALLTPAPERGAATEQGERKEHVWEVIRRVIDETEMESTEELTAVLTVLQRWQPGGSPPPGDSAILAAWILDSLRAERDKALAAAVEAARREEREELRTTLDGAMTIAGGMSVDYLAGYADAIRGLQAWLRARIAEPATRTGEGA